MGPRVCSLAAAAALSAAVARGADHPFRFEDLAALDRLTGFSVSPDGRSVVCAVATPDVPENKMRSALWVVPAGGGEPRRLTSGEFKDAAPAFSPDGRAVAFLSNREGKQGIWTVEVASGEPRRAVAFANDVAAFKWSPDGRWFVFTADVFPDCSDADCTARRLAAREKSPIKARIADRLLYRHWDSWRDGLRTHIWRAPASGGAAVDLTPGNADAPPFGQDNAFEVSPDGKDLVYSSNPDTVEAVSTNSDVWVRPFDGSGAPRDLTAANKAFDGQPHFSPDGKTIAYLAQRRPGFESDRFELMVIDRATGASRSLTADFDRWAQEPAWAPDGKSLVFVASDGGRDNLYRVPAAGGAVALVWKGGSAMQPAVSRDGKRIYFSASSLTQPADLWSVGPDGSAAAPLTKWNAARLAAAPRGEVRERWITASDGAKVQAFLLLPPGFDPSKKYPAIFFVHGGPQVPDTDAWSYRWNLMAFAGYGYVVYTGNFHGSPGWGQKFVDSISRDWGGIPYDDLMRQADDLESLPFVDKTRIAAAGASFGGYMMAWLEGHTTRFATMICHDGTVDLAPANLATEELWFPRWEFGGWPWESGDYEKWNPLRFANKFATPMLVITNEKDYRVPFEQGLELFTALQLKGVPSRLVTFPDEGHWVLKPGNALLWHNVMVDWLHRWIGGAPADPETLSKAYSVTK